MGCSNSIDGACVDEHAWDMACRVLCVVSRMCRHIVCLPARLFVNLQPSYAERMGKTLEEMKEEWRVKMARGEIEMRSIEEEASRTKVVQRAIFAMDVAKNTGRALFNATVGWFGPTKEYKWSEQPINLGEVLDVLNRVHAHEIFIDGAFNGDPHPGNILLMPDGRIGLIDYGQVKRLPMEVRIQYAKLIVALAKGDKDDVVDQYIATGVRTK